MNYIQSTYIPDETELIFFKNENMLEIVCVKEARIKVVDYLWSFDVTSERFSAKNLFIEV